METRMGTAAPFVLETLTRVVQMTGRDKLMAATGVAILLGFGYFAWLIFFS
jgi:hypothetical protein